MKRLGVNIDHVATVRNARGDSHPDPYYAALQVVKMGADSVTIHLREDRRHINDLDAKKICKSKKVLINLEISINDKIVNNALRIKPDYICLVPENRKEVTTEGGLNLVKYKKKLKEYENWFFRTQLDFWRSLSGRQFEIELASLLKKHGHTVKVVGGAGDKGIDIILDNNTAVQCKAHKSKVGPAAIRDLIGSMQNANYKQGILASVNGFSKGVYEYNKKNNIELLDASNYIQMQKELSDG